MTVYAVKYPLRTWHYISEKPVGTIIKYSQIKYVIGLIRE